MKTCGLRSSIVTCVLALSAAGALAQAPFKYDAILSGVPLFDNRGQPVSAHGANIVKDGDTFYLFGEAHADGSNAFAGVNAYSSKDLMNWTFEGVALPVQARGALGPETVGERPKVMKSPTTGEYVMFIHADGMDYKSQFVGYATAKTITGPYAFQGPVLFEGKPIKKWDMGTFQDKDGAGYVLLHGGDIYRLADDYKSIAEQVNKAMDKGFESPALFEEGGTYYFLGSNLTGWERNDNYYYTAPALKGPWTRKGLIAPEGTRTWNSQVSFVLPVRGARGTTYLFMGDRWSFPRQATAATYVWQPLVVGQGEISLPLFQAAWKLDTATGLASSFAPAGTVVGHKDTRIRYAGPWRHEEASVADNKEAAFSFKFSGTRIGWVGAARPDGGYAQVTLRDGQGKAVLSSSVDLYSRPPRSNLVFQSPVLARGDYTLDVRVLGENWYWVNKKGVRSGIEGVAVALDKIVFTP